MKKNFYPAIWFILAMVTTVSIPSCQKAHLVEEWPDKAENTGGRNSTSEQSDSTKVTPNFEAEDWEGGIDVNFGFGN